MVSRASPYPYLAVTPKNVPVVSARFTPPPFISTGVAIVEQLHLENTSAAINTSIPAKELPQSRSPALEIGMHFLPPKGELIPRRVRSLCHGRLPAWRGNRSFRAEVVPEQGARDVPSTGVCRRRCRNDCLRRRRSCVDARVVVLGTSPAFVDGCRGDALL